MDNDTLLGIGIIIGIIAIGLFGGAKSANYNNPPTPTESQNQKTIEQKIQDAQTEVNDLKKKLEAEELAKTQSKFKDKVTLSYVNRSMGGSQEYIVMRVSDIGTSTIPVTGWTLKSLSTGTSVTIPQGTYLYFMGTINSKDNIILQSRDTFYLITGTSPIGYSFKLNKCSGYLSQFQTFIPYLWTSCPSPRDENLSSIPGRVENDACFDYIESFPNCRIQTTALPNSWSYECKKFINEKINYSSCVDTHKSDKDFYVGDWRVYLGRTGALWKERREDIVLYDLEGKIVSELKY